MLLDAISTWLWTAFGLWLATLLVPGVRRHSTKGLLIAAFVLGLLNVTIRPVLWLMTLPLSILSFGLVALLINALMIKWTGSLVKDFEVDSFGSALLAALLMVVLVMLGMFLIQWWFPGEVHWEIYLNSSHSGVAI